MSSIRPGSAKSAPGASTPMSSALAFPSSVPISINAGSTTAATLRSPDVRCAAHRREPPLPLSRRRMSGFTRKASSLPRPAAGGAGGELRAPLRASVVDGGERSQLAALDEHNIVRVMLPEAPNARPPDARYAVAAALLSAWRQRGVLMRDPAPALYVLAQDFTLPSGVRRTRCGVFAG